MFLINILFMLIVVYLLNMLNCAEVFIPSVRKHFQDYAMENGTITKIAVLVT